MTLSASLSPELQTALYQAACGARGYAYAPYSNYTVGAALLAADGRIFSGCNIENAAFGPSNCAERTAVFKAVSEGVRTFTALAVVTRDGGMPCGVCRQVLREFAPELTIFIGNDQELLHYTTLGALLPESFGPDNVR